MCVRKDDHLRAPRLLLVSNLYRRSSLVVSPWTFPSFLWLLLISWMSAVFLPVVTNHRNTRMFFGPVGVVAAQPTLAQHEVRAAAFLYLIFNMQLLALWFSSSFLRRSWTTKPSLLGAEVTVPFLICNRTQSALASSGSPNYTCCYNGRTVLSLEKRLLFPV